MSTSPHRYSTTAIILHWVMALCFFAMLIMGLTMTHAPIDLSLKFKIYQWHKSLGLLLLVAFFFRLFIRVKVQRPDHPEIMKPMEIWAATLTYWALYLWMFILPISGWIMVSASPLKIPTFIFGWFEWPHFPYVAADAAFEHTAEGVHKYLAYTFMVLIGLHIAGYLKHLIIDKHNILPRMGIGRNKKEL
jgi:cytochrome b561